MKKQITLLLLLNTVVLVFFNLAHPVTPAILSDKNMPDSLNGILFSLMSLGMVIASPFWGRKIKSKSTINIMIITTIGYGFSQMLLGFGASAIVMGLGRLFSGIFAAGWIVSTYQYMNLNVSKTNKTKYFGFIMVSNAFAAIIGQLVSGALGDQYSIYLPFLIQAVGLSISAIGIFLLLPDMKTGSNLEKEYISNVKKKNNQKENLLKIIEDKSIYILVVTVVMSLALVAYTSQIGYYVSTELGAGAFQVGIINSYTNFITVVMNIYFVHKFEKKVGEFKTLNYGMYLAIIGILLAEFSMGFGSIIGITLLLLGLVTYRTICQKYMLELSTLDSSEAIGYINSANAIGMVLGSFVTGFLYQSNPIFVAYFITITLLIGIVVMILFKKELRN